MTAKRADWTFSSSAIAYRVYAKPLGPNHAVAIGTVSREKGAWMAALFTTDTLMGRVIGDYNNADSAKEAIKREYLKLSDTERFQLAKRQLGPRSIVGWTNPEVKP